MSNASIHIKVHEMHAESCRQQLPVALWHFSPKGHLDRSPGLGRFQNGAFSVAARHGMPLVPLIIKGTRTMLPAEHWLPKPARLSIAIQTPLFTAADPVQARDICRQIILAELGEPDLIVMQARVKLPGCLAQTNLSPIITIFVNGR